MDKTTAKIVAASCAVPSDTAFEIMRLSLVDWMACGIAGLDEPVARLTRELALSEGGAGQATMFGGARAPARSAAQVNGATSHALDYDDTHFAHIGHPSVAVIPAALAVAEGEGADGTAFLEAALVGVEASVRVGVWLGRGHYQAGFHQTGTAGAFGATLAAARLLGCDAGQAGQALGLVSTAASGLKSQFGTMGKPYNAGHAAAMGVEAALLAARGFVSTPVGLEGPQGFGETHHGAGEIGALEGLGEAWLFEGISHKFHACCHGTHAALEALASLGAVDPGQVTAVTITTNPRWLRVCNLAQPRTGLEAKFSYRLTAAMVLAGRDTGALETFSDAACTDPLLLAMRDRVEVETDEGLPETAAHVAVVLADGTRLEASHDLDAPMPLERRAAKLRAKARALLGEAGEAALHAAVMGDAVPDLAALGALLRGEA